MSRHRHEAHRRAFVVPKLALAGTILALIASSMVIYMASAHTARQTQNAAYTVQDDNVAVIPDKPISELADPVQPSPAGPPAVPADSGEGRRIVFSQTEQRVWLVEADGSVNSNYLVSGSREDNLQPGTYSISWRVMDAVSFDYSGSMKYFMEFTSGPNAPIGFHSIPVDAHGHLEQSIDQLGQPLSAGCIRQSPADAAHLWDWAPNGTPVVVVA